MKTFKHNITNLGEKGLQWLAALPAITEKLTTQWNLSDLQPIDNMTWNFVVKAIKDGNVPVVLKVSHDKKLINDEFKALRHFDRQGSVEVIDYNFEYNALLLSQAIPGESLRSLYPLKVEEVMDYYVDVVQKLCSVPKTGNQNFNHISDWLTAIDKVDRSKLPHSFLEKAIILKNHLLETINSEFVLHGDLHHDNILQHHKSWISIDPKGIIGDKEFEVAAFDFIHETELNNRQDIPVLFQTRVKTLAQKSDLNLQRLSDWVFVRLMLGACWMIEDNGNPSIFINPIIKIFS